MGRQRDRRIDERDRSWARMRRLTGWATAASVAFAGLFGIALVRHDQAAAAPANQQQSTTDPQTSSGTRSPRTDDSGGNDDSGSSSGTGSRVIQPPAAPPLPSLGGGHVTSGGS